MLKNDTVRLALRRFLSAVFIIAAALIQNSASGFFPNFNYGVFLLIPLCICISMYEKEFAALFYGILTGALCDLTSSATDGIYALLFALIGCACGLLSHYVLRNTLKTAMLLSAIATALFLAVTLLFNCVFKDYIGARYFIRRFAPGSLIATLLISPVIYFGISYFEKLLRSKET